MAGADTVEAPADLGHVLEEARRRITVLEAEMRVLRNQVTALVNGAALGSAQAGAGTLVHLAAKAMTIADIDGNTREVEVGEPIPEVLSWPDGMRDRYLAQGWIRLGTAPDGSGTTKRRPGRPRASKPKAARHAAPAPDDAALDAARQRILAEASDADRTPETDMHGMPTTSPAAFGGATEGSASADVEG
jgi:hypothetical protein